MTYADAHRPITGDFGFSLSWLKAGGRVRKVSWRDTKKFLMLVPESEVTVEHGPLLDLFPAGTKITYREHIDFYDDDGKLSPYIPNTWDMTEDWEALQPELPPTSASPAAAKAPEQPLHSATGTAT